VILKMIKMKIFLPKLPVGTINYGQKKNKF
jgi:hypothetical protein